jgi:hypothetical protein
MLKTDNFLLLGSAVGNAKVIPSKGGKRPTGQDHELAAGQDK